MRRVQIRLPQIRLPLILLTVCTAGEVAAACHEGPRGAAYDLGHRLAFRGTPTTAAAEVARPLATCFAIGYREGTLQRLLRSSQPNPPRTTLQRPRGARNG